MWTAIILSAVLAMASGTFAGFPNIQATTLNGIHSNNNFETGPFTKIGQKYYYIEDQKKKSWFGAAHACRQLSAHLAFIENEQELDALSSYLVRKGYTENDWLWISGNDLVKEGSFTSIATGNSLPFTRWSRGQPDNSSRNENCVNLWRKANEFFMNDLTCTREISFICQANDPRTIAFTVW